MDPENQQTEEESPAVERIRKAVAPWGDAGQNGTYRADSQDYGTVPVAVLRDIRELLAEIETEYTRGWRDGEAAERSRWEATKVSNTPRPIEVTWEDSCSADGVHYWQPGPLKTKPLVITTRGFLLKENKRVVVIASSIAHRGAPGGVITIPKSCITERKDA